MAIDYVDTGTAFVVLTPATAESYNPVDSATARVSIVAQEDAEQSGVQRSTFGTARVTLTPRLADEAAFVSDSATAILSLVPITKVELRQQIDTLLYGTLKRHYGIVLRKRFLGVNFRRSARVSGGVAHKNIVVHYRGRGLL